MMQLLTFIVFTVHEYKSKLMGFECKKKKKCCCFWEHFPVINVCWSIFQDVNEATVKTRKGDNLDDKSLNIRFANIAF